MKRLLALALLLASVAFAAEVAKVTPADAARRVKDGTAVLVDIREMAEWRESGVAAPALLLPKSDFDRGLAGDWKAFLEKNAGKEIILYCRLGKRAATVGAALAEKGFKVANAGGFDDWARAGLPVRQVESAKK